MTPKEKAEELYRTYIDYTSGDFNCKQCALIAVNEMIAFSKHAFSHIHIELATPSINYLEEVKQEIEKL